MNSNAGGQWADQGNNWSIHSTLQYVVVVVVVVVVVNLLCLASLHADSDSFVLPIR